VVDDVGVHVSELLDESGGAPVPAGAIEFSAVLMTAKISMRPSRIAAAPALRITGGRSNHDFKSSSSSGTPEC
jgi:hypothetical protein